MNKDQRGTLTVERQPPAERAAGRSARWLGLIVFVVALVTMGRLCTYEFLDWDDRGTIYANPKLNPPTWENLKWYWAHEEYGLWIPGTYTVWEALATLARVAQADERGITLNPWVFHTFNVLLHGGTSVMVFALLRRLFNQREASKSDVAAALGALVFAVHPVQVESVGWISGGKDLLCGFFSMLALWFYVGAAQKRSAVRYAAATLALGVGMICKPAAMVTPAMAVVIDALILRRGWRQIVGWTALWWAMSVAIAIVAKHVQTGEGVTATVWWMRPLIALDSLAFYAGKLVWPWKLGVDYGRMPVVIIDRGWIWWTWIVPVGIGVVVAWVWARERWIVERKRTLTLPSPGVPGEGKSRANILVAGVLVFVIGVAPMLGLTRFLFQFYSTVADHYLYLSMLGVGMIAAWIVLRFFSRGLVVGSLVVIAALAVRSIVQAGVWKNDRTVFEHALWVNPDSFLAIHNLGTLESRDLSPEGVQRAAELFRLSIETHKRVRHVDQEGDGHKNLGNMLLWLGKYDQALAEHEKALEIYSHGPKQMQGMVEVTKGLIARDKELAAREKADAATAPATTRGNPTNRTGEAGPK